VESRSKGGGGKQEQGGGVESRSRGGVESRSRGGVESRSRGGGGKQEQGGGGGKQEQGGGKQALTDAFPADHSVAGGRGKGGHAGCPRAAAAGGGVGHWPVVTPMLVPHQLLQAATEREGVGGHH